MRRTNGFVKGRTILPIMIIMLAVLFVISVSVGAVNVPFFETLKIFLKNFGIIRGKDISSGNESIIFMIRLPRVVIAVFVGAALATSGAVMQGMFRNPMADPGIIGVSSGSSLGAVIAISMGMAARSLYIMPFFAVAGALSVSLVIFVLSSRRGKTSVLTLILSGIAVSTFVGSITSLILSFMNQYEVKEFLFWTMGGLENRMWDHVKLAVPPIAICLLILFSFWRELNIMLLGDEEAQSVGLNPSGVRRKLIFFSSITTATAVCVSGTIGFVGLLVPHIMRLIVGPDHKILLLSSALGGAIFLVGCDLISRVIIRPGEIRVGIITSLIGAPYFLYLLNKARKEGVLL